MLDISFRRLAKLDAESLTVTKFPCTHLTVILLKKSGKDILMSNAAHITRHRMPSYPLLLM